MKLLIIIKKELIDQIRDKRTIIAAVFMPAVIVPLLLFLMMQNTANEELTGPVRIILGNEETELREIILQSFKDAEFVISDSPAGTIRKGEADLWIDTAKSGNRFSELTFYYDSARRISALAYVELFGHLKSRFAGPELSEKEPRLSAFSVRDEKESKTLITLSVILPVFLIVFAASSTMSSVIDMSSGEKERSTIETLISCNVARGTIILGKILAAGAIGFSAVVSLLSGLVLCSWFFPRITGGMSLGEFSGAGLFIMLFITLNLVLLFASLGMAVGLYAKSVKEGTILTLPIIVLSSAISSGLIGGDPFVINELFYFIPVFNLSYVIRSVLYSHFNGKALVISLLVNLSFTIVFFVIGNYLLRKETVINRS